jgi:hypothetical protein
MIARGELSALTAVQALAITGLATAIDLAGMRSWQSPEHGHVRIRLNGNGPASETARFRNALRASVELAAGRVTALGESR